MHSSPWRVLLWILSAGLLAGCQPRLTPALLDPITDTEPACWLEICPGSTTQREALNFLLNHEGVTVSGVDRDHPVNPSISWSVSEEAATTGLASGSLFTDVSDAVVTRVVLDLNNRVSLRDAVSRFGPGSEVVAYAGGTEQIWMSVTLHYPDRGILIRHTDRAWQMHPSDTVRLKPGLRVDGLALVASSRAETPNQPLIGTPSIYPYIAWPGWDAEIEVMDLGE